MYSPSQYDSHSESFADREGVGIPWRSRRTSS